MHSVLAKRQFCTKQSGYSTHSEYKDLDDRADVNVLYNEPGIDHDIIIPISQFGFKPFGSVE